MLNVTCQCLVRKLKDISADDDDEEDAEPGGSAVIASLEDILASLTRRMIKAELEDFELV